jgi:topoisomerase-4 subunit A
VLGLRGLLTEWISYRLDTVTRRLQFRLEKVETRLHILEGLLVAYLNIDEVIRIIRSEDKPKPVLMKAFSLTDVQAEAILELKLRHLARLEEVKIRGEQEDLAKERKTLAGILRSKARLKRLVRDEITADADRFGDDRRTAIVERRAAQAMDESELISSEPVTVILSRHGWIRAAKGHDIDPEQLSYKSGDAYLAGARGRSNQPAVFMDTTGRAYTVMSHTLPSARGQGEPLSGRVNPPDGAAFAGVVTGGPEDKVLLASSAGYGFVARLENLFSRTRSGKAVLRVPKGAEVLLPAPVPETEAEDVIVAAATSEGRLLVFPLAELPELARGKGNKIIGIPPARFKSGEERMIAVIAAAASAAIFVHCGQRTMTLKPRDLEKYAGSRGRRGALLPRGWRKVEGLAVQPET